MLDVAETEHVAGTFEQDGAALVFDFAREGTRHTMTFHSSTIEPLVSTTLEGAYQSTSVLGGRLVASGVPNAPNPSIVGDQTAQDELDARPEAALLEGLHDALVDAGIDHELFQPTPPEVESISDAGGGYFYFAPGESLNWLSAAGASPTYIYVRTNHMEYGYYGCVMVIADPWSGASDEYISVPRIRFGRARSIGGARSSTCSTLLGTRIGPTARRAARRWYASRCLRIAGHPER